MDAAVTEPTSPTIGYTGRSIEERVSVIEGTITNQNRIFDMLHEGQKNLRADIAGLRAEMHGDMDKRFGEVHDDMDKRFGEVRDDMDKRFGEVHDDMDKRFGEVRDDMDKRFGEVGKQFGEMNTRFGEVGKQFGEMNTRFGEMDARIAARDVRLNTKIDSNLKWILGVQIAMWLTIIAAIL
jgi:DNA anti-recombination protein RmuC